MRPAVPSVKSSPWSTERAAFTRLAGLAVTVLLLVLAGAALAPSHTHAEQAGSKIHRRASGFLAAGARFSCARLDTGQMRCWGFAFSGQLGYGNHTNVGDNETPASVGPVNLGAGRTARAIAAGFYHVCAILDQGQVLSTRHEPSTYRQVIDEAA